MKHEAFAAINNVDWSSAGGHIPVRSPTTGHRSNRRYIYRVDRQTPEMACEADFQESVLGLFRLPHFHGICSGNSSGPPSAVAPARLGSERFPLGSRRSRCLLFTVRMAGCFAR